MFDKDLLKKIDWITILLVLTLFIIGLTSIASIMADPFDGTEASIADYLDKLNLYYVKKQLVNDPTFMNSVRAQVQKAADEASKGVSQGWSDQKVLDRLQATLLPISGLVANKIDELGSSAGNIADNKVDDTVHKFLPGKLGDWVSDKVGNKVNNIVQNKVNDLGGQVTDLIDSFIKQFTCGKHE